MEVKVLEKKLEELGGVIPKEKDLIELAKAEQKK